MKTLPNVHEHKRMNAASIHVRLFNLSNENYCSCLFFNKRTNINDRTQPLFMFVCLTY
ncbi:hypothetical protein Hanom_Chr02g00127301 [Helianthus anomalus]